MATLDGCKLKSWTIKNEKNSWYYSLVWLGLKIKGSHRDDPFCTINVVNNYCLILEIGTNIGNLVHLLN